MELIFIISMIVFAVHYTLQDGEVFGAAQKINLGKMSDPLRDCPVCMVPYYGSIAYWLIGNRSLTEWAVTIIASLGLNAVLVKLFPDKDTPGLHQEITELSEAVTDIGQTLKPIAQEAQFNAGMRISKQVINEASRLNKQYKKKGK